MDLNKQRHPLGTKREKLKFAFFPVLINGKWHWLKNYIAIQVYQEFEYEYEELHSEGIIFDTYRKTDEIGWTWRTIDKKLIEITEEDVQNLY